VRIIWRRSVLKKKKAREKKKRAGKEISP
jgi:hypothetical protein